MAAAKISDKKRLENAAEDILETSSLDKDASITKRSDLDPARLQELGKLSLQAMASLEQIMRDTAAYLRNLTQGEIEILLYLSGEPEDCSPIRIAESIALTRSRVTQIINKLEDLGLVSKTPDPTDKRKVTLAITKRGQQACDRYRQRNQLLMENYFLVLGEQDTRELVRLLSKTAGIIHGFDMTKATAMIQDLD